MKVTFFYGLAKNAGKTTTLNLYLSEPVALKRGVTSIGWDGESYDHLFGHSKPSIYLSPNTYLVTYERFQPQGSDEIATLDISSPFFGKLKVYRTLRRTRVQLVGPKSLSQLRQVISFMRMIGIEELVLDGAVDRRVGFEVASSTYIVLSPIVVPMRKGERDYQLLVDIARAYHQLFSSPTLSSTSLDAPPGVRERVFIKRDGGVTEETLEEIWREGYEELWLENPSRLILFATELPKWLRRLRIRFFTKPKLERLVWNPFDSELGIYDKKALRIGEELAKEIEEMLILELVRA